ncbi:Cupredoxin, partial [Aureobasidium sp. EXF-3399]
MHALLLPLLLATLQTGVIAAPASASDSTASAEASRSWTTPPPDYSSISTPSSRKRTAARSSLSQSAYIGNETYSNGTTRSLTSCAASLNGSIPSALGWKFDGKVRRYYVAAEEVEWNYAPTGWDNWLGVPLNDSIRARQAGYLEHGTVWTKALYRGFTDATFTQLSEELPFQGTLGPTLRAEVGDLIEILFVNNLTSHYATMHSMGLSYTKFSEGADYPDTGSGTHAKIPEEDAVPPVEPGVAPGGCVVYKWMVTDIAGPNYDEPARTHSYHSYVSIQQDTNAGLIGPTIIYAKGTMDKVMAEYREIPFLFNIYEEDTSFLSGINAKKLTNQTINNQITTLFNANSSIWYPQEVNINGAGQFSSAPSFRSINGYVYSNNPVFEMCLGDKVLWYAMSYGSAAHVFHMHGNAFTWAKVGQYAIALGDGVGKTLVMDATGPGLWQVVCHVESHLSAGMVANYKVYSDNCPLKPLAES